MKLLKIVMSMFMNFNKKGGKMEIIVLSLGIIGIVCLAMAVILVAMDESSSTSILLLLSAAIIIMGIVFACYVGSIVSKDGDLKIQEYEKVEDGYKITLEDGTKIILDNIVFINNPNECPFEH